MFSITPVQRALVLAADQHGLVSAAQCRKLGISRNMVQRLVGGGRWLREAPGIYRVAGTARTWHGRALAATLAAGPTAVVSHRSAAHLWGLAGFGPTGRIELTVARHRRPRPRPGMIVRETTSTALLGSTRREAIPVTGPPRTLVDLAAVATGEAEVVAALDEILRLRLASWEALWAAFAAHAHPGRPGITLVRAALDRRYHGPPVPAMAALPAPGAPSAP